MTDSRRCPLEEMDQQPRTLPTTDHNRTYCPLNKMEPGSVRSHLPAEPRRSVRCSFKFLVGTGERVSGCAFQFPR